MIRYPGQPLVVVQLNDAAYAHQTSAAVPVSSGDCSGDPSIRAPSSRRTLLRQFQDETPARWMAFLRAHFSGPTEVSMFFEVDEKTGRNWWKGSGRPTLDKALVAEVEFPASYQHYMIAAE